MGTNGLTPRAIMHETGKKNYRTGALSFGRFSQSSIIKLNERISVDDFKQYFQEDYLRTNNGKYG